MGAVYFKQTVRYFITEDQWLFPVFDPWWDKDRGSVILPRLVQAEQVDLILDDTGYGELMPAENVVSR